MNPHLSPDLATGEQRGVHIHVGIVKLLTLLPSP